LKRAEGNFAFAPDGLAADSGPAGGFEIRQEFGQIALIFGGADEAPEGVALAGACAAARRLDSMDLTASHADVGRAQAAALKIDIQRSFAVEPS